MQDDLLDERSLIRLAQAGDRDALERLVEHYVAHVQRISRAVCRDPDRAEEVGQDMLLALVRSLKDFRADAALSSWLFAIGRHACLRRRRPRTAGALTAVDGTDLDRLPAAGASPEAELAHAELLGRLHDAIRTLDAPQREVLILRDVVGVHASDAAHALGVSVPALKSRLHRARTNVRTALLRTTAPRIA